MGQDREAVWDVPRCGLYRKVWTGQEGHPSHRAAPACLTHYFPAKEMTHEQPQAPKPPRHPISPKL